MSKTDETFIMYFYVEEPTYLIDYDVSYEFLEIVFHANAMAEFLLTRKTKYLYYNLN